MTIPEQIRRQSEAIAKMYNDGDQASEEATGNPEVSSEVADSAASGSPESAPNEQRRSDTSDTAEQRYRTLQGMYNADTARLRAENQQLNSRLSQLEQLLSSMSATPAPAPQTYAERLVTDKDVEEYGESIDVMRRVSQEETRAYQSRINELEQQLRALQTNIVPRIEHVAQRQAMSAEQAFWAELSAAIPSWRDINANPEFHKWLLDVDPMTGLTRQAHLDDAQRNLDTRRVTSIFSTWQGSNGQSVAQPTRSAAASQLDRQVAPGRSRSGSVPTVNAPKTYTRADIAKFFDDVRKGVYRGREDERNRIESDIFAAERESRIVANG